MAATPNLTWRIAKPGDTPGQLTPEHGPIQTIEVKMNFICHDCANSIHNRCRPGQCTCQHRVDRKNIASTDDR